VDIQFTADIKELSVFRAFLGLLWIEYPPVFNSDVVMLEVPVLSVNVFRIWAYQNWGKTAYL